MLLASPAWGRSERSEWCRLIPRPQRQGSSFPRCFHHRATSVAETEGVLPKAVSNGSGVRASRLQNCLSGDAPAKRSTLSPCYSARATSCDRTARRPRRSDEGGKARPACCRRHPRSAVGSRWLCRTKPAPLHFCRAVAMTDPDCCRSRHYQGRAGAPARHRSRNPRTVSGSREPMRESAASGHGLETGCR